MKLKNLETRLLHTLKATVWMFGGRGLGLLWTVFLIHQFGIADYGRYAMAFAVATLIAPIDYYFFVGSVRSSDEEFRRERATRLLVGAVLMAAGLALYDTTFVIGFGVALAGGETAFNALQSTWMRAGRPDKLTTNLTLRQTTCIVAAVSYVLVTGDDNLHHACLVYLVPYLLSAGRTFFLLRRDRPQWPRNRAKTGLILLDAFTLAGYHQTDVLYLGTVVSESTAGYYATASVTGFAAAAVGGSYAQTFHEPLRASGGDPQTGPPVRQALTIATVLGMAVFVVGVGLAVFGAPAQLWGSFLIIAPLTTLTFYKHCLVVVLIIQQRDVARVTSVSAAIVLKAGILVALTLGLGWGAVGAATAALIAEIVLVTRFYGLVHGRRSLTEFTVPAPDQTVDEPVAPDQTLDPDQSGGVR